MGLWRWCVADITWGLGSAASREERVRLIHMAHQDVHRITTRCTHQSATPLYVISE